jgi:malate dehydrogenase (oxaloacetate-decarboxylating)
MNFRIKTDPETKQPYMAVQVRGRALLINPFTNKGTAFPTEERDALGLHGLLPPAICTLEQQLDRVYDNYKSKQDDMERYIFLTALQDRNETLFFKLVLEHLEEMLPIIYTPAVGAACQRFSHIYRRARGLYVNIDHLAQIDRVLQNPEAEPSVIVVTDGERILGLGDQGVGGMGIPIGKLSLYTLCAGIAPHKTMAIMLDAGTDNADRLADPLYLGLRRPRVRGEKYQEFVDAFVESVNRCFPRVLLQWEDFAKGNAIHQLARFRDRLCTFNDDIQGTAAVVLAGLYAGLRITRQRFSDERVLLAGAGAAAQGIAELLVTAFQEEGLSQAEARGRIWTFDSKGLVTKDRANLEDFKAACARDPAELGTYTCLDRSKPTLAEVILNVRPSVLLGTSGTPGTFNEASVRAMAKVNERPLIFPLSNPTSKAECTASEAVCWSDGRGIVASGSPFKPVDFNGTRHRIGQANNAWIFPGMGLGITVGGISRVTNSLFLEAAKTLATAVRESDLREGTVYPEMTRIRECSREVAIAVICRATAEGHASDGAVHDLESRITASMWSPGYLPMRYEP